MIIVPRQPRRRSKTDCYHVILRGNNKDYIFVNDSEKEYFIKQLYDQHHLVELIAWCIMDNHVHLILKAEFNHLSTTLKRISIKFAKRYHNIYGTSGHIFQDRFRSEPIESEGYLLSAIRYVHNNPVNAKLVNEPKDYRWSSYNNYILRNLSQSMAMVMSLFNDSLDGFALFHNKKDDNNHLEIKEDSRTIAKERLAKAIHKKVNDYSIEKISSNKNAVMDIVDEFKGDKIISLRMLADAMGVSYSTIQRYSTYFKGTKD